METKYKFHSDTNLGLFVGSLDMRIPGNMYEVDYTASIVTIKCDVPHPVESHAFGLGAEKLLI